MSDGLRDQIARKVRERLVIDLGPNTVDLIKRGRTTVFLHGGEAEQVADAILDALADLGAVLAEHLHDTPGELAWFKHLKDTYNGEAEHWVGLYADAKLAVERVDALHQPKSITEWTGLCPAHNNLRLLPSRQREIRECPDCSSREVLACSDITCCGWPCRDHLALHDETPESCTHGR